MQNIFVQCGRLDGVFKAMEGKKIETTDASMNLFTN